MPRRRSRRRVPCGRCSPCRRPPAPGAAAAGPRPGPPDRALVEQGGRRRSPRGAGRRSGHQRQRLAAALGPEVHLGREAAPAAAERLDRRPPLCPGGVLVRPDHGPVDEVDAPSPGRPAASPAAGPRRRPGPRPRPAASAGSGSTPSTTGPNRSGRSRQGAPVASCQRMPSTIVRSSLRGRPRPVGRRREQRTQPLPLSVRQCMSLHAPKYTPFCRQSLSTGSRKFAAGFW